MRGTVKAYKRHDVRKLCGKLTLSPDHPKPEHSELEAELLSRLYREIFLNSESGSLLHHLRKVQDEGLEIKYVKPRAKK